MTTMTTHKNCTETDPCMRCCDADMRNHAVEVLGFSSAQIAQIWGDSPVIPENAKPSGNGNGFGSKRPTPAKKMATEKQLSYIRSMVAEMTSEADADAMMTRAAELGGWTIQQASEQITETRAQLDKFRAEKRAAAARELKAAPLKRLPVEPVTEGFYTLNGVATKVVTAKGSGRLYAKQWDNETERFEYAPGIISRLSADMEMTAEEAAKFGQLTGYCVFCSRTLTDDRSLAVGYGPVCADKRGMPWG